MFAAGSIPFDVAPFCLSGMVYGVLLNHPSAVAELGHRASLAPYLAPPRAPVLYIKPRNTLCAGGDDVEVPPDAPELEVGACLGLVIGRTACRVSPGEALTCVAGYLIVNDVSVPHEVFYRPSIRFKARDGFCPLGPAVLPRARLADPDAVEMRTYIDGELVQTANTAGSVRGAARLISDVTEFMTLAPGDVLAMGAARPSPRVRAGQRVEILVEGIGSLSNRFVGVP